MIRFNVTDSTPLIEFDVESNVLNMSAEDVRPVTVKDYSQLNNKPSINDVTLEGNLTASELDLAEAPLVGTIGTITPAQAASALQAGRSVVISATVSISGMPVPVTMGVTLITATYVGGTATFSMAADMTAVTMLQLVGDTDSESWGWYVTDLARERELPTSEQIARWDLKQDALRAGENIDITDDEISVTGIVPKAALTNGIPFGQVDSTSTATAYTATVPGITELKDGVCVILKNGVVTSAAGFTININGLGAKNCYTNLAAATAETTIFNVNYTMLFVYDSTRDADGGWICYRGSDANTNTIGYQLRTNSSTLPMDSIVYRYRLLFRSVDGQKFVPANNSSSTNATAARTTIQTPIDPFGGIYYYGTTAAVDAGSRPSAAYLWTQYIVTLGYSFNRTGAALALTTYKPLYIKALPQASGGAVIDADTPYVQALPTTNDGYIYIYLGIVNAATTFELAAEHPVYYYDGTRIRHWS